jgi:hypothetical protein
MSSLPPAPIAYSSPLDTRQRVIVTDVEMPFGSMVVFIIKWVLASIPALIILWLILLIISVLVAIVVGSIFHGMGHGVAPWHF